MGKRLHTIAALPLAFALMGVLPGGAGAGTVSHELSEAVSMLAPGEELPVIVRLKAAPEVTDSGPSRSKTEKLVRKLRRRMKDSVGPLAPLLAKRRSAHKELWIINGISLKADAATVKELSTHPKVAAVTLDASIAAPVVNYGTGAAEWNVTMVGAPELWSVGKDGAGTFVASLDTGVDINHADLRSSWRGGAGGWYDPYGDHPAPHDANGHGTMITGIMNGGASGGTGSGVAPGAKWMAVKIFRDNGYASVSAIHQGFQWLLDPDGDPATDDSPVVVNNSWGLGNLNGCSTEFSEDIAVLSGAGIITVFAAGNYGPNQYTSTSPANNPGAISVGALDSTGAVAGFSSAGPSACGGSSYPALTAPGFDIKTAGLTYGGVAPLSYNVVSGTSFASAHVSGGLALLAGAFPTAPPGQIVSALLSSAEDLGPAGADNQYGAGLLKLKAAYELLAGQLTPTPPAPDPPAPADDQDADGFSLGQDCVDTDASIHPGAVEVKLDGVDQDCNGYDLTITVTRATYSVYKTMRVEAKSSLGAAAALRVDGFGAMSWSPTLKKWVLTVRSSSKPATVTVSGTEGSETVQVN